MRSGSAPTDVARWEFFRNGWNVFDFVVIAIAFVPGVRESSTLLRLARLARVVRIVRLFPDLRVLLAGVWRSIPPLFAIGLATAMLLFVYGMVGWSLFHDELPDDWGNIGRAMLTLFVMLTLENFPVYMDAGMEVHPWSWVYFVSFILIAAFVVINVLIGIVLNSMEEAREEERRRAVRERLGAERAERRRPGRERAGRRAHRDPPRGPRRARGRALRRSPSRIRRRDGVGRRAERPSSIAAMRPPVLLAVDEDESGLRDVERELVDRYARHYEVVCLASAAEARARLEALAERGRRPSRSCSSACRSRETTGASSSPMPGACTRTRSARC